MEHRWNVNGASSERHWNMNDPSTGHQRNIEETSMKHKWNIKGTSLERQQNINGTSMVGVSSLGVKIWKKNTKNVSRWNLDTTKVRLPGQKHQARTGNYLSIKEERIGCTGVLTPPSTCADQHCGTWTQRFQLIDS